MFFVLCFVGIFWEGYSLIFVTFCFCFIFLFLCFCFFMFLFSLQKGDQSSRAGKFVGLFFKGLGFLITLLVKGMKGNKIKGKKGKTKIKKNKEHKTN